MDILCLMGLFPKEYEKTILENSISGVQNAANKLQWALVDGLMAQEDTTVSIINSLYIGSYPARYKKLFIPSFEFSANNKQCGYNVGFLNLSGVKVLSRYLTAKKKVKEWAKTDNGNEKVIIAYAMTSPMVELLQYVKSNFPKIKCILFTPDLPDYMNFAKKTALHKFLKRNHKKHLKNKLTQIDGYVFLTDHMKEWFEKTVNYTVIEGLYNNSQLDENPCKKEKVILYAGGICKEYGVADLVDAFRQLNAPDWKLELIGDGPLLSDLEIIAKEDSRIILRGLVPNKDVVKRQKEVSLLVNPRKGQQVFTKYSFPSKTIEYMASGTPMVGYRLAGIPEEYFEFFYEIPMIENGIKITLESIINTAEASRIEMGLNAEKFIKTKKNAKTQCSKILDFIKNI